MLGKIQAASFRNDVSRRPTDCVPRSRGSTREVRMRRGWRLRRLALEPEDQLCAVSHLSQQRSRFGDRGRVGVRSSLETLRGVIVLGGNEMRTGLQELQRLRAARTPIVCSATAASSRSPHSHVGLPPWSQGMNTGVSQQEGTGFA